jgi:hypothetical protein
MEGEKEQHFVLDEHRRYGRKMRRVSGFLDLYLTHQVEVENYFIP